MTDREAFFKRLAIDGGIHQLVVGDISNPNHNKFTDNLPSMKGKPPEGKNMFFAPALRKRPGGEKDDVLGSTVAWVDIDDEVMPDPTFPPSAVVWSGHGWHLYYWLSEPVLDLQTLEDINKILITDIPTADAACWNANRLMRVPGSWNMGKDDEVPTMAELRRITAVSWHPTDFLVLSQLDAATRYKIRTGTTTGYPSRSERDWSVIRTLCICGASDQLILQLFELTEIGDKFRSDDNGTHYLNHTVEKVREQLAIDPPEPGEQPGTKQRKQRRLGAETAPSVITHKADGYYMVGTTSRRISTFTLEPKLLLDSSLFDAEDAIVCDVTAGGRMWEDITFPKSAFSSVVALDKRMKNMEWSWVGMDQDVRLLLPYLLDRLREKGFPHVLASPTLGLHTIQGEYLFLGDKQTLSASQVWEGTAAPLSWLPSQREHPKMNLATNITADELERIAHYVPRLNEPATIWAMIGWYAASCMKPWLEEKQRGYRMPILNITGTKGSGKTTLSERIIMPLFGQPEASAYDAGTTKFVMLTLLGGSNAVPVAFSEFRYDAVEKFIRMVLLAYDTGHDPRGRADQTTQDYALSAPFSVNGEDVIADPAARERIVLARLKPATIAEGTECYKLFNEFRRNVPVGFGAYYIQQCLAAIATGDADKLLAEARRDSFQAFPTALPDRVRSNYIVAHFGAKMFARSLGVEAPCASIFAEPIGNVVNLDSGRSRSLVDEYVEAIVSAVSMYATPGFKWHYEPETKELYFQMMPTHAWWLKQRRQQGRSTLEVDAMLQQIKEAAYIGKPKTVDGTWMYSIKLIDAQEYGLDVTNDLGSRHVTFVF